MEASRDQVGGTSEDPFAGRLAVVTGGGTGMGRELVVQLAGLGCSVATCDINGENVRETVARATAGATGGARITAHPCDVAVEAEVLRFRDEVIKGHSRDYVNLVFNNAGIHGMGSFIDGNREEWDKIFAVCWTGVYNCCRAFVPLLVASDSGRLVNTSSVNGMWAVHSAYSAAKFAVKGFTEALINEFRVSAPHVKVFLVMPGYVGTDILANSRRVLSGGHIEVPAEVVAGFREAAPMSAAQAATVILEGVRSGTWRILVGEDARKIDELVRADPLAVYGAEGIPAGRPARPRVKTIKEPE